ncbi:MAG TPA: DivIVA domain-containing protein [Cytophagaceae bacterium]|jgi:cell division initiation protein|nr:DivIVA domain-containing protein [Cytophagaceae bacterium]
MKITPIEIRQKEFVKAFRGYEKEEVDVFLEALSKEWERVMEENRDLAKRVETAEKEVVRLREVEGTLYRTLKSAEDTGNNIIDHANKTADLHMKQSQMNAESIMNEARTKARAILEDADEKSSVIMDDLANDLEILEKDFNYILSQREQLLKEIKAILDNTSDKIGKVSSIDVKSFETKLKKFKKAVSGQESNSSSAEELLKPDEKKNPGENLSFFDSIK